MIEGNTPSSSWPDSGKIEFDDYSTRYRPELDLVVRNITVDIRGGEKVNSIVQHFCAHAQQVRSKDAVEG